MPGVELFEILIAAAESKNLSEAAAKLRISQPAVSVKLKALEKTAPLPIFRYEGKRKALTHYGRELYRVAKDNQQEREAALETLHRRYASPEKLTLRVGGRKELFEILLQQLRFEGRIDFLAMNSSEAVEQLKLHKVDVAISYGALLPDSAEIVAKKIFESVSEFVVHRKLLPPKPSEKLLRDIKFLSETPCVIYEGGGHSLREWVEHLGVSFDSLRVRGMAEDWRIVKSMIENGWGYGICPAHIKSQSKDLFTLPVPASVLPKFTFYALFHRDLKRIPAFRPVLEIDA